MLADHFDTLERVHEERFEPTHGPLRRGAREPWACIIFNLHTVHTPEGLERASRAFRGLIDRGIERGGSYYLTYHRWATRRQIETCYSRFVPFLAKKIEHDPDERFQSQWPPDVCGGAGVAGHGMKRRSGRLTPRPATAQNQEGHRARTRWPD